MFLVVVFYWKDWTKTIVQTVKLIPKNMAKIIFIRLVKLKFKIGENKLGPFDKNYSIHIRKVIAAKSF